jgi:hypothetical protein
MSTPLNRRRFLARTAAGLGALTAGAVAGCNRPAPEAKAEIDFRAQALGKVPGEQPGPYPDNRPNVVLVRFGGGVRRRETIDFPHRTLCPFITQELAGKHGVLFENVEMASAPGVETSHGQGTLYILTGTYRKYADIEHRPFADRFEAEEPTLPEYLRKRYTDVAAHQTLIVNGEDRVNEEFYTFSNNHLFGVNYRSTVLSLYGFKRYLLREQLREGQLSDKERQEKQKKYGQMVSLDYRTKDLRGQVDPRLEEFWASWRHTYGDTGLVNPRGDRLLTALTLRAMKELRPRFIMVNYQDPDYVHWGPAHFYTRSISVIDEGVRELYSAVQADEFYRDRTVFVVVPDCGRDNNRGMAVPYQHHFNTKSAHEIFAIVAGPKKYVPHAGRAVDRLQQQISVAATVGEIMGFRPHDAEAESLFKVV